MQRTEAERQFYLSMAGIRMWYARDGLPGAAPSPEYLFPEESGNDPSPEEVSPAPAKPAPSRSGPPPAWSGLKAMVSGEEKGLRANKQAEQPATGPAVQPEPPPEQQESVPEEPAVPTAPLRTVSTPVKLGLGIWAGGQYLLVSELSEEASARLQDSLATNILRAMGDEVVSRSEFHWPVFANGAAVNDASSLADCLGRLGKQYSDLRSVVLGFGEPASDDFRESRPGLIRDAFSEIHAEFPHTLAGLATSPERKRELWVLLKPLAGRL